MSGTAIELLELGLAEKFFRLYRRLPGIIEPGTATRLDLAPEDPAFALRPHPAASPTLGPPGGSSAPVMRQRPAVRAAGSRLLEHLVANHQVKSAIQLALAVTDQPSPIYLIAADLLDWVPWETLHHQHHGFLALDGRWPIARLPNTRPERRTRRDFTPPLEMVAVLSALGLQAEAWDEWNALYRALQASRQALQQRGIGMRLRVLVSDLALKSHLESLSRKSPALQVDLLQSKRQLGDVLRVRPPHLVHFFCHGSATASGAPYVELATRRGQRANLPNTVTLEARDLIDMCDGAWLVTLNCCEGARASAKAASIASTMASSGFPAVVAMREPIAVDDANCFCGAFYRAVFEYLAAQPFHGGKGELELEWAQTLNRPRQALRDLLAERHLQPPSDAAAQYQQWTLPVMYVSDEAMIVHQVVGAEPPKIRAAWPRADKDQEVGVPPEQRETYHRHRLNGLLQARAELHAKTPAPILDAIDQEIRQAAAALYLARPAVYAAIPGTPGGLRDEVATANPVEMPDVAVETSQE